MRLMRFCGGKSEFLPEGRIGLVREAAVLDLASAAKYLCEREALPGEKAARDIISLLQLSSAALRRLQRAGRRILEDARLRKRFVVPLASVRVLAPIPRPNKLLCLAGNYEEHLQESGYSAVEESKRTIPWVFMKPPSTTIIGGGEKILISRNNVAVDWEVELAVVIGKKGRFIAGKDAFDFVFGYTILNDISERRFDPKIPDRKIRERDKFFDWLVGKWFDTFAPSGPVIVTKDELGDPHNLRIALRVNGQAMQDSSTRFMVFKIPRIIEFISSIMTLEPGDIIATGTPEGVGMSRGIFLSAGDRVECEIEGIGILANQVAKEKA
jgi:2-keto-4-pentenoate hydratase/2-oxohepta-3-ene-1,7-dioic acid hydratase in catechol pathway